MCLILIDNRQSENGTLIIATNRDEYHHRKTEPAHFWPDHPSIFGGRDIDGGGSWLCVDTKGRLAAITNIRKPPFDTTHPLSRGLIVNDFLNQNLSAPHFLKHLCKHSKQYGYFNALFYDHTGLWHFSNDTLEITSLAKGMHTLCNADINTPWAKSECAKAQFIRTQTVRSFDQTALLNILQNRRQIPDENLPNTGVTLEFERLLSSTFIQSEDYGTRSSTLVRIPPSGQINFLEWSYDPAGNISHHVEKHLVLTAS